MFSNVNVLSLINLLVGGGLLLWGRKVFWLFVGAIGFLIGLEVASRITFPSELALILAAVGLGIVFALLAAFVETVAIGIAGVLGGGLTLMRVAGFLGLNSTISQAVAFVLGGILGVILVVWLFNWALITLSSFAGASMIVSAVPLRPLDRMLVFLGLVIVGVLVQGLALRRERSRPKAGLAARQ